MQPESYPIHSRHDSHPAQEELAEATAPEEPTAQMLLEKIRALEEENRRLRQNEHSALQEAKIYRQKLEKLQCEADLDRQELSDLREIVFRLEEGSMEAEQEDDTVSFPYTAEKEMVVIGGHDGWLREIKPKLPNVRFLSCDAVPDLWIIRNADMVWFQTNYLSHKSYDWIIKVARTQNIPVRYFKYSSARKCAEQLMREDCA